MNPANCIDISGKVLGSRPRQNIKTSKRDLVCHGSDGLSNPIPNIEKVKNSIKNQGKLDMLKNLLANGTKKVSQDGEIVDRKARVKEYTRTKSGSKPVSSFSIDRSGSKEAPKANQLFLSRSKDKNRTNEVNELKTTQSSYLRSRNPSNPQKNKPEQKSDVERQSGTRSTTKRGPSHAKNHTETHSTNIPDTQTACDSEISDPRPQTRASKQPSVPTISAKAQTPNLPPAAALKPTADSRGVSRTRSRSTKHADPYQPSKLLQHKQPFCVSRPSAAATPDTPPQKKHFLQQTLETLTLGKRTPEIDRLASAGRGKKNNILDEDVFLSDAHQSPRKERQRSQDSWRDKSFEKGATGLMGGRTVAKSTYIKQQSLTVGQLPPTVRPLSECLQEMLPSQRYVETVQDIAKGKIPTTDRFLDLDPKQESDTVAEILTLISANLQTLNRLTDNVKTMNENKALDAVLAQALIETANRSQLRRVLDWIQATSGIQYRGKRLVKEHVLQEAEKRLGVRLKRSKTLAQLEEQKQVSSQNVKTKEPAKSISKMIPEPEAEEDAEPPGTLLAILGGVGELAPSVSRPNKRESTSLSLQKQEPVAAEDDDEWPILRQEPITEDQPQAAESAPAESKPEPAGDQLAEDAADGGISLLDLWQASK